MNESFEMTIVFTGIPIAVHYRLYLAENIMMRTLMTNEKAFVIIIGKSSFRMPYHIQPPRPVSNIANMK